MYYSNLSKEELIGLFNYMGLDAGEKPIITSKKTYDDEIDSLVNVGPWLPNDRALSDKQLQLIIDNCKQMFSPSAQERIISICRCMSVSQASVVIQNIFKLNSLPTEGQMHQIDELKASYCPEVKDLLAKTDYESMDRKALSGFIGSCYQAINDWKRNLPTDAQLKTLRKVYRQACGTNISWEELAFVTRDTYDNILKHYQTFAEIEQREYKRELELEAEERRRQIWREHERDENRQHYDGWSGIIGSTLY